MNWRPKFEQARATLKPAPEHSRQRARKLMRDIAKMEASKAKREARKPGSRRGNVVTPELIGQVEADLIAAGRRMKARDGGKTA